MKKIAREILGFLLFNCFYSFLRPGKINLLSIYFHNPDLPLFRRIVEKLRALGYQFISIREFEKTIEENLQGGKQVLVTFDDGWSANLELVDTINQYAVPVTIFIPPDAVTEGNFWWEYVTEYYKSTADPLLEKAKFKKFVYDEFRDRLDPIKKSVQLSRTVMTREQVVEISQNPLVTIGSHSLTHPILVRCGTEALEKEISNSKTILEGWINNRVDYLAYPNGDYNDAVISECRKAGYKMCFSTRQEYLEGLIHDKFTIPRFSVNDDGGFYENLARIFGLWQIVAGIPNHFKAK